MRTNLTILLLLCSFTNFGQGNCFEDYKKNSEKYDSLKLDSNGQFSLKKAIEINDKIINGLIGCKIPYFNVKTIDGKILTTSELKGKVIILNFWFEACAACVAEIPLLNKLEKIYKDSNTVFIAFSIDDSLTIRKFLQRKEFNYNIVSSTREIIQEKFCLIGGYPTNMVFDTKGILRQIFNCRLKEDGNEYKIITQTINKYMKEN
jgi:peroxiredoxin